MVLTILVTCVSFLYLQIVIWRNIKHINIKALDTLVTNVSIRLLIPTTWNNIKHINIKALYILVTDANIRLLIPTIWNNTKKPNMKVLDTLVTNANMQLINLMIWKNIRNIKIKALYTYTCDQCEFTTYNPYNLKQHKEIEHEGVLYPCVKCVHLFSSKSNLLKHKRRKPRKESTVYFNL